MWPLLLFCLISDQEKIFELEEINIEMWVGEDH